MGLELIIILLATMGFVVVATARWKLHPFLVLLGASYGLALLSGINPLQAGDIIQRGFGQLLGNIGLVIVFGTIIGVILEKSGATLALAETIIRWVGERFPGLTLSVIGYIVSIPVFCDSGYVILSSLKQSITKKTHSSPLMMSVALATGLYASHTLVPPTPGPIAAAGNLGLMDHLGLLILVGLIISVVPVLAGYGVALWCGKNSNDDEDLESFGRHQPQRLSGNKALAIYPAADQLPSSSLAFAPIVVPLLLIALGSIAAYPTRPLGDGEIYIAVVALGNPVNALVVGFVLALRLVPRWDVGVINDYIGTGLKTAAPILLITGAGGAFGAVLKATPIVATLTDSLSQLNLGLLLPFVIASALKTAQGSSTVAIVTTSAVLAPLLPTLGLDSDLARVLVVMSMGAGAMTVSHANDSFFWVVAQFSGLQTGTAYRCFTLATLVQGLSTLVVIMLASVVLL